jgi:hypothetical protein
VSHVPVLEDYFAAAAHPYWRWEDEGNVIAWSDGTTIAFRAELVALLERMRPQTLPPIGSVVLLLAACRDSWREPPRKSKLLYDVLKAGDRQDRADLFDRVVAGLDKIRGLQADVRTSLAHKAELAAMVFEGQGNAVSPSAFDRLLDALRSGAAESYPVRGAKRTAVDWLLRDLAWLDRGLSRVDEASLRLRVRTGLEQPVEPAPVDLPPQGTARSLIADLKNDPELYGVARLAEWLLAAVMMPRPLSEPEELPLGGVSDISNRGSLDRLLLSELANDDLTLAVRVAMNEALYLRRETPPRTPSRRRLVLLDAGLRMWGVPRVFATAVGLALAAGIDPGVTVAVFRAAGAELVPVDMTTAAGLTDHMAALDHRVHPGASLDRLAEEAEAADETTDVVVVTADDVAADRNFQRALAAAGFPEMFLATVARDGSFELTRESLRGKKVLKQAQLDLEAAFAPPKKPTAPLVETSFELPAVFRVGRFPLLLSAPVEPQRSWHVSAFGVLTLTTDGRLLHWETAQRGARQLAENLPAGGLHWASCRVHRGEILAVIGKRRAGGLYSLWIPADGSPVKVVRLESAIDHPQYVFAREEAVFIGDQFRVEACSATSGISLGFTPTNEPGVGYHTHRHDGIFTHWNKELGGLEWTTAAFSGSDVSLNHLLYGGSGPNPRVAGVYRIQGRESALGITTDGGVLELETRRLLRKINFHEASSIAVERQSRSGARLLVAARSGATVERRVVDLMNPGEKTAPIEAAGDAASRVYDNLLEPELFAGATPVELRHKFSAIGVDSNGRLVLVGRRDRHWPVYSPPRRRPTLVLASTPVDSRLKVSQPFVSVGDLDPNPYELAVARFGDGSRAVLDGRGLLHLKSSDATLPEMTLVLRTGDVAGWTSDGPPSAGGTFICTAAFVPNSDGRSWGSSYFLGGPPRDIDDDQLRTFTRFVERLS